MQSIKEQILQNKPNISDSSIKTYLSLLKNLFNKYSNSNKDDEFNKKFFIDNYVLIIENLQKENLNSRKTKLSSIVVLLGDDPINEKYKFNMMNDIHLKKEEDEEQLMNDKQKYNKLSQSEIKDVFKMYYNKFIALKLKGQILNKNDFDIYQSYILLCLISGIMDIPPRRLLDYVNLKIIDDGKSNYYDEKNKKLIFRIYKTKSTYGTQEILINDKLNRILKNYKLYLIKNNIDYFFTHKNNQINTSQLNLWINSIFSKALNKNIKPGINGIRKSYLTERYKNIPALKQMMNTAQAMGHSIDTALTYIKK